MRNIDSIPPMDDWSEPGGWGEPGSVRHAERIGHGEWLRNHPRPKHNNAASARLFTSAPILALGSDIPRAAGARCETPGCVCSPHPLWWECTDVDGNQWFAGDES